MKLTFFWALAPLSQNVSGKRPAPKFLFPSLVEDRGQHGGQLTMAARAALAFPVSVSTALTSSKPSCVRAWGIQRGLLPSTSSLGPGLEGRGSCCKRPPL